MSYYSENDWRYYSEDYLEHKSLRDRWNDLMDKTTIDDNIKKAAGDARTAVTNAVDNAKRSAEAFRRSDTAHTLNNAARSARAGRLGDAARSVGTVASRGVSGAAGKVRNMFNLENAFPNGKNSQRYNELYYKKFRDRILEAQKAYREAKKNIRKRVRESDNKIDDALLRGYERGKSNLIKGGVSAADAVRHPVSAAKRAGSFARLGVNRAIRDVNERITKSENKIDDRIRDTYRGARDVVNGGINSVRTAAGNAYDTAKTTVEGWQNDYRQRRMEAGGSQRRRSNKG